MEAISVRNLSVSYENNAIIENMDLSIPKGKNKHNNWSKWMW